MFNLFNNKSKQTLKIVDELKYAGIFPDEIKTVLIHLTEHGLDESIFSKKFRDKSIWFALRIVTEQAALKITRTVQDWYECESYAGSCVDLVNHAYSKLGDDEKYQFYPLISAEKVHLDYFYDGNVIIRNLIKNAVNELEDKSKINTFKKDYYDNLKETRTDEYKIVTLALENNFYKR